MRHDFLIASTCAAFFRAALALMLRGAAASLGLRGGCFLLQGCGTTVSIKTHFNKWNFLRPAPSESVYSVFDLWA